MTIRVTVDTDAKVVILALTDTVTRADFVVARQTVTNAPGWLPTFAHVLDFTAITALELSHEDVRALASATPIFDLDSPQILVARAGSVHFGLARMFQTYSEGHRQVHVVPSIEDAHAIVAEHRARNQGA